MKLQGSFEYLLLLFGILLLGLLVYPTLLSPPELPSASLPSSGMDFGDILTDSSATNTPPSGGSSPLPSSPPSQNPSQPLPAPSPNPTPSPPPGSPSLPQPPFLGCCPNPGDTWIEIVKQGNECYEVTKRCETLYQITRDVKGVCGPPVYSLPPEDSCGGYASCPVGAVIGWQRKTQPWGGYIPCVLPDGRTDIMYEVEYVSGCTPLPVGKTVVVNSKKVPCP